MNERPGCPLEGGAQPVYRVAGLAVASAMPLAAPATDAAPAWVFEAAGSRPIGRMAPRGEVVAERHVGGEPMYTIVESGDSVVVRFHRAAEFRIDRGSGRIVGYADPRVPAEILPILLVGTVTAYLLAAGGGLVLHASAIEVDGGAVAFVGGSGQGKTTLAALCCAAGYPLVADDVLPVRVDGAGGVAVVAGAAQLRVRAEAAEILDRFPSGTRTHETADHRRAIEPACRTTASRLPLVAIVLPQRDRRRCRIEREALAPGEAALHLAAHQRVEGWRRPVDVRSQFAAITQVIDALPVWRIRLPWGPPFSDALVPEILGAASSGRPIRPAAR